jgi:trans-aconitate methyltransferase
VATTDPDSPFQGPVPLLYQRFLVPLIFQPYADELAARVAALAPDRLLEVAAGTGVVTRALAARLPVQTAIVATDQSE